MSRAEGSVGAEEVRGRKAEDAAEAKQRAVEAAHRRAVEEADLKLVSEERAKAEARLQSLSARRWPVMVAVASAIVLSLLLGVYVGWRQPPEPAQGVIAASKEPLKLRLDPRLGTLQR
jgi:hypothetical protein